MWNGDENVMMQIGDKAVEMASGVHDTQMHGSGLWVEFVRPSTGRKVWLRIPAAATKVWADPRPGRPEKGPVTARGNR